MLTAIARDLLFAICALFAFSLPGWTQIPSGSTTDQHEVAEEGFRPMFNGRDLEGWVLTNTPAETWSFQNGMLICTGKPIGEIRTAKMYQNFIMELQWRHMVPRGNAGIFVWADDITSRGVPFHRGIEVQVLENEYGNNRSHTTHGDIFPIHGAKMTPINGHGGSRAFPTEFRSNPSPQWNHYRIECRDGEIALAVNGKIVTRGKDCVPRKGYICIESEGGIVHYRNVRIKELPDTPIDPAMVAIADRGYRSIYNGLNLNGWTASSDHWESRDWILAHAASPGHSGTLMTDQPENARRLILDFRLKDASSSVQIDANKITFDSDDAEGKPHLEATGKWNRIEAKLSADDCWLKLNGNELTPPAPGTFDSLTITATGPVDIANVYVADDQPR